MERQLLAFGDPNKDTTNCQCWGDPCLVGCRPKERNGDHPTAMSDVQMRVSCLGGTLLGRLYRHLTKATKQ